MTVYDTAEKMGGQILLVAAPPRKSEILRSVEYYEKILPSLGVEIKLGQGCGVDEMNAADAVIVAVGAQNITLPVPGADGDNVVSAWDVLAGKVELSGKCAVIGGGLVGTETAGSLLERGCQVAVVEMLDKIAAGESSTILPIILKDFAEHDVEQFVKTQVTAITANGMEAADTETKEPVSIPCDWMVMAVGSKKVPFSTDGVTVPVKFVGDCSGERTASITEAIRSGYHAANEI